MMDFLIHTSDIRVDILLPKKVDNDDPCICFSLNIFISHFGEFVYLFDKKVLIDNFYMKKISSGGVECNMMVDFYNEKQYRFRGQDLGNEFRIYDSIDVRKYCIGVINNFNHMKGILEQRFNEEVIRWEIDFSRK